MKSSQVMLNAPEGPSVSPTNFVSFLPWACKQLMAPFQVIVVREELKKPEEATGKLTKSKTRLSAQPASLHVSNGSESSSTEEEFTITLSAIYDTGNPVEIIITRCKQIPQLLFKIIAICVPYNPCLQKFTINRSQLEGSSFHEISNFLPHSNITEICLDDTISYEAKYDLLLQTPQLKILSLARCKIGDSVCGNVVAELEYPKPASRGLLVLNLTSNMITDVGAERIGSTLRGNRQLQYLNLSGNFITDEGASHVLRHLMEFPLTDDEILAKRMHRISYLKSRPKAYNKCEEELKAIVENASPCKSKDEISNFRESNIKTKVKTATNRIGEYDDPYGKEETIFKDKCVYCVGNFSLCWLNLAFNNLEYPSLVKLSQVLDYQSKLAGRRQPGLLRVIIEGNDIPISCRELELARQSLDVALEPSKLGCDGDSTKTKK